MSKQKKTKKQNKHTSVSPYRWVVQVFFLSVSLSAVLSLLSGSALEGAGLLAALAVLLAFILLGILFDIVGVAVTAADERPFHSMAAHKERGAAEALMLLRNAGRVSSVCNDVVGDICGIVSGTTAAVIVTTLQRTVGLHAVALSVGVTSLISGLTIGGKALGKHFALRRSTDVVFTAGKLIRLFRRGRS